MLVFEFTCKLGIKMTTAMGPPPPRNPNASTPTAAASTESETSSEPENTSETTAMKTPMGPPAPRITPEPEQEHVEEKPNSTTSFKEQTAKQASSSSSVPYTIPEWSGAPCHNYYLEVLKDGSIIDLLDIFEKGAYMFGRVDICDFVLEHPTISRFHAVLQFKRSGDSYLYDLSSTHGTFINKTQIEKRVYVELHVGDVIRFGHSSRLYIFQGPSDLMPPEKDLNLLREAKIRQEMIDRASSLRRARAEASLADGISWGMGEDAIEEDEDDNDEITWQTFKGQLTEKQEKTRDKVIKRTEKIAHMKKEIDAIRAKDIAQGGLSQGQQTQIARNEQRIAEILEELESLEETLNDSIQESIGARGGRSCGVKKGATEDDEDFLSDDDEFYDRTKKPSKQKASENQSIETADTLLDKRDAITKEIEDKKEALLTEKNKMASETAMETEAGDVLDAYMSGLSSQLVLDKTLQLEKELAALQSELDRVFFLLKIADPSGYAAKKRDLRVKELEPGKAQAPAAVTKKQPTPELKKSSAPEKPLDSSVKKEISVSTDAAIESNNGPEAEKIVVDAPKVKPAVYTAVEPQWLGAVHNKEVEVTKQEVLNIDGVDQFVDYKDRQKVLLNAAGSQDKGDSGIEDAASGLIIRKHKETERPEVCETDQSATSSAEAKFIAEDAVALLLKHKRGYYPEDQEGLERQEVDKGQRSKDNKRPKRVLGPEKPSFINSNSDYESWVPPEGQTGDGRTSLNDRLGY